MKTQECLKREGPRLLLLAVPFLVLVPLWDKFPARVAIHWGLQGQPNGWADKFPGLLLLPCANVGLALLFAWLPCLDARRKTYSIDTRASFDRVVRVIGTVTTAFMSGLSLLVDAVALGWRVDVLRVVNLGLLVLFAVLGNYLPKLRPNRFVGIRTPWTLRSPEVWQRTHRVFGMVMLMGSLVLLLPCVLLPGPWSVDLVVAFVLLVTIGAMIYSYACFEATGNGS